MDAPKFKIGDRVKVVDHGRGCSRDDCGKVVTITEIGRYNGVSTQNGYKVSPPIGNTRTGSFNGFIGELSFKRHDKPKDMSWKEWYTD